MSSENRDGFVSSLTNALRPGKVLAKVLYMVVIISLLSIREFIYYLNVAGETGKAWWTAILPAYRSGLAVVFTSVWNLIVDISTGEFQYFNTHAYGNLIFGTLFILGAIYVVYQPVSVIINILDMKKEDETSVLFKIGGTIIAVVIISAIVYYSGGAESVLSTGIQNSSVIENVTTNITSNVSNAPTISLI